MKINGNTYIPCAKTTLKQDWRIRSYLTSSIFKQEVREDHLQEDLQQLVYTAIEQGVFAKIIATTLEEGSGWTEDSAKKLEAEINACTDTVTKNTLQDYFIEMILNFFQVGLLSFSVIPTSSTTEK